MNSDEAHALRVALTGTEHPTIVELGAHRGEDAPFLESLGIDQGVHVMVEADPFNCARIKESPFRIVIHSAIGRKQGTRNFHVSAGPKGSTGSGSILEPTGHLKEFPEIQFPSTIPVPCTTLDALVELHNLRRIDLLYVDIQGAEGEMIEGGQRALSRTRYLFMEAEEKEFYRGQLLRSELLSKLVGWTLIQEFDANVFLRNDSFQ